MSTELTFATVQDPDGATVLSAAGEIDMSNAAEFSAALDGALAEAGDAPVVVDLTKVDYIDSAGLAVVFPHIDRVRLVASEVLAPVLTVVGLDDVMTVRA
ncbi:STAS domain-containing protein [Paractinoplanes atraurantiacus]|uniref:Anti-anti-sigma factor n=1 Tax=Paractinoplanes atraurantiacus TaxID=1036182 RepID=A0A285IGI5_9ACTN|nr:STAS domain-containing protein [Actinoplanes atraurantiacus]SNY47062.1 anti-anti-sigma factor [Actinoplanes atraurantiacus]